MVVKLAEVSYPLFGRGGETVEESCNFSYLRVKGEGEEEEGVQG